MRALVERRRELELKQSDVAERVGATQQQVSKWEAGASGVPLESLQRYARGVDAALVIKVTPLEES